MFFGSEGCEWNAEVHSTLIQGKTSAPNSTILTNRKDLLFVVKDTERVEPNGWLDNSSG